MLNLLRQLPLVAPDLRFAAVTRHPELVPDGVEPLTLQRAFAGAADGLVAAAAPAPPAAGARPLPARTAARLGRPSVVTLHDLHFERDPSVMGLADRLTFKAVVPRAAKRPTR